MKLEDSFRWLSGIGSFMILLVLTTALFSIVWPILFIGSLASALFGILIMILLIVGGTVGVIYYMTPTKKKKI